MNAEEIEKGFLEKIHQASSEPELEKIRLEAFGRSGAISELLKTLGAMSPEQRKSLGPLINGLKNRVTEALAQRCADIKANEQENRLAQEALDITLPTDQSCIRQGRIHPVTQVIEEACSIFVEMGFILAEGPDIETDYYNFTALNFSPDHPARDMHDTFFLHPENGEEKKLLRTHTSPVQIRVMQKYPPPLRIIIPGKTYRVDSDATHTPMFHQLEGLVVDKTSNIANMRWVLEKFCKVFFEAATLHTRFRPSFFPFTKPSFELDIQCDRSSKEKICAGEGKDWLEILGCGMVHPNVLCNVGLDPEQYQGFAWGMGIDRLAMLKYGIPDLRSFFDSEIRWLSHYGFRALDIPGWPLLKGFAPLLQGNR